MTDLRLLCRALLDDASAGRAVAAGESFLWSRLAEVGGEEIPDLGGIWTAPAPPEPRDPAQRRRALRLLAPWLLLEGVWLARVARPATGHRETECHLLRLYLRTVGGDDPAASPPRRCRAAMQLAGVTVPPLTHPEFFADPAFPKAVLALSAAALVLWHRPGTFLPELLGFAFAHVCRTPGWWDALPSVRWREDDRALASAALAAFPDRAANERRIRDGWQLYQRLFTELCRCLAAIGAAAEPPPSVAMAAILQSRCREAVGYHGAIQLQGKGLDAWLAESAADPRPLLRALAQSSWVDRSRPERSRLIRAMDFGGPMFGVFNGAERQICVDWISALADAQSPDAAVEPLQPSRVDDALPGWGTGAPAATMAGGGPVPAARALYRPLLLAESPADRPPAACAYIDRILRRTRWFAPFRKPPRRGFVYTATAFTDYVAGLHRHEVDRYRPLVGTPPVSREFCRWAILQLAPAILVDGAWLAGVGTAAERLGDIGGHLLRIYADELGDGRCDWNHPNVYRRLLASEGLQVAPLDSAAFTGDGRLLDAAFAIPTYLLAMGLAGHRYFPELLGLNLAIELSGLGAGYLRVVDILRSHGIDPAIVQLHLSIDNLATGHAGRARDAILLYLDGLRREGEAVVQAQWRRVWTGYLSLDVAALGLAAGFARQHFRERLGYGPVLAAVGV